MTTDPSRFGESIDNDDLLRFVDGALDDAGRVRVLSHLASRPAAIDRVEAYLAQNARLRDLRRFLPMADSRDFARPLQAALVERLTCPPQRFRRLGLGFAAALAMTLLAGVIGLAYQPMQPEEVVGEVASPALTGPVLFPYAAVGSTDALAVESMTAVAATDDTGAFDWLERHVRDFSLTAPALDRIGLTLVGGETMEATGMPVIRIRYEDAAGSPVILHAGVASSDAALAFRSVQEGQLSMQWRHGPMVFALIARANSPQLSDVVELVGKAVARIAVPERAAGDIVEAEAEAAVAVEAVSGPLQAIVVPLARPEPTAPQPTVETTEPMVDPALLAEPPDKNEPKPL